VVDKKAGEKRNMIRLTFLLHTMYFIVTCVRLITLSYPESGGARTRQGVQKM